MEGQEQQKDPEKQKTEKNTSPLQAKRTELAQRLRTGYWQLDPYLRAKTLYDRLGVIREGGKIQFYDSDSTDTDTDTSGGGVVGVDAALAAAVAGAGAGPELAEMVVSASASKEANATEKRNAEPTPKPKDASKTTAAGGVGHRDHELD